MPTCVIRKTSKGLFTLRESGSKIEKDQRTKKRSKNKWQKSKKIFAFALGSLGLNTAKSQNLVTVEYNHVPG